MAVRIRPAANMSLLMKIGVGVLVLVLLLDLVFIFLVAGAARIGNVKEGRSRKYEGEKHGRDL